MRLAPDVMPFALRYEREMRASLDSAWQETLPELKEHLLQLGFQRDAWVTDATIAEILRTFERTLVPRALLDRIFGWVDREQSRALQKRLPGLALPQAVSGGAALADAWVRQNTGLIRMAGPLQRRIEAAIREPLNQGLRVEQMADLLQGQFRIERRRAELIARDQTLKLAGQLQKHRQTQAGIARYTWTTSDDERVREDHADLDGQVFSWDDPPVVDQRTGRREHPGGDYQCRCTADPYLEDDDEQEQDQADFWIPHYTAA